jgi:hypothetical protein
MIGDPDRRGRALAAFALAAIPRLWRDVAESGGLPDAAPAREEWECFALYACVRGLVAAGGFNRETAAAIDAMHEAVLERWSAEDAAAFDARRARAAERYSEYGGIGQDGGASGAATVTARLGAACARHLGAPADADLAALVGAVHEALVEGAAEAVRIAG